MIFPSYLLSSDWYFWIPLYAIACAVNFSKNPNSRMIRTAKFDLCLGIFLFMKVSFEDFVKGSKFAGFWSLNMRERSVREKFGSGLVISSMFLLLQIPNTRPTLLTKYGMPILVGVAYGLSFIFFAFQHAQMKY
ncbi:phosphopantetheine-protein transferase domain [Striga asiatica]|uniref:Phosphopantetheine-protein transferase domain n=1 Tax=Striga asiatica TaxID=4170 RepID=A0A5A7R0Y2_STRAF|nr:phosphopantetheine-protein transferase domain [Striga asiatica]